MQYVGIATPYFENVIGEIHTETNCHFLSQCYYVMSTASFRKISARKFQRLEKYNSKIEVREISTFLCVPFWKFVQVCKTRIRTRTYIKGCLMNRRRGPSKIPFRYLARLSHCSWISWILSWILVSKSRPPPFVAFDIPKFKPLLW